MSSKCDVCFTSVIGLSNVIFLFVNLCYQIALFSNSLHSHSIPGSPVSWLITSQGHCNPHSCGLDFLGQFGLHKLANKRDRSFPYNIQRLHLCFDFVPDIPIHIIFSHIDFFVTEYHKHWFQPLVRWRAVHPKNYVQYAQVFCCDFISAICTYGIQHYFTCTWAILQMSQCQRSKPEWRMPPFLVPKTVISFM